MTGVDVTPAADPPRVYSLIRIYLEGGARADALCDAAGLLALGRIVPPPEGLPAESPSLPVWRSRAWGCRDEPEVFACGDGPSTCASFLAVADGPLVLWCAYATPALGTTIDVTTAPSTGSGITRNVMSNDRECVEWRVAIGGNPHDRARTAHEHAQAVAIARAADAQILLPLFGVGRD